MKKIELFGGRMLVEVDDFEERTRSGIYMPEVWEGGRKLEGAKNTGRILQIGDGTDNAETIDVPTKDIFKTGDKIIWTKHHQSYSFRENGKTYSVIKLEHVLGKVV